MSTETPNETNPVPAAARDELAVAAVRGGEAERYRELVERYERRVYAVAWSRLGDAGLAEEAAQETFVRAYRRLALLGEGAKFGAWISAIARHVAISLGLRHRRELDRRERWLLEQPQVTDAPGGTETERGEILREALAGLPENQRECLVLFYFEGKSTAEAARTLGISEAALRVRLHRARAALREKLEESLGESLRELRPARSVAPGVMAVVLSSSTAKTAGGVGAGAGILAWLGKVLPVKVAAMAAWMAPLMIFIWVMGFFDRRKLGDPRDVRVRLQKEYTFRERINLLLEVLVVLAAIPWDAGSWDTQYRSNLLVLLGLSTWPWAACIVRYRAVLERLWKIYYFFPGVVLVTIGLGVLPNALLWMSIAFPIIARCIAVVFALLSTNLHKNLFLRAMEDILKIAPENAEKTGGAVHLNEMQIREFAQFLGQKELIADAHWENGDLRLALPTVRPCTKLFYYTLGAKKRSELVLKPDGRAQARIGILDKQSLSALAVETQPDWARIEEQVGRAAEEDWRSFREENPTATLATLGAQTDKLNTPSQTIAEEKVKQLEKQAFQKRQMVAAVLLAVFVVAVWILAWLS